MMKKVLAIILSLALLSTVSVTAFAASPITYIGGSDSAAVKGTYAAGSAATKVYSVDIAWGSMEFTYSQGTWDPETHRDGGGTWSCAEGADKITVTNHSNAAVIAQFSYASASGYNGINGTFSENTLNLGTAVGTEFLNAPSGSVTLSLDGALSADTSEKTTIGTVTVTLGN